MIAKPKNNTEKIANARERLVDELTRATDPEVNGGVDVVAAQRVADVLRTLKEIEA